MKHGRRFAIAPGVEDSPSREVAGLLRALGIDLAEEQHGKGPVHYASKVGTVVLEVYPLPDNGTLTDTTTRLGFAVEKLAVVAEMLHSLGIPVPDVPQATEWGKRMVVRDPDGRAVEVYER